MKARAFGKMLKAKSPLICLFAAIGGVAVTSGLLIRTTAVATKEIDAAWEALPEEEKKEKDDFTLLEKFQLTWKLWIPSMVSGAATITFMALGYRIHENQLKTVSALYSASEASAMALQQKMQELVGKKKTEEIMGAAAKEEMSRTPQTKENTANTPKSDDVVKFYDAMSGRYFYDTIENVKNAYADFNIDLSEGPCAINELYLRLQIPEITLGKYNGWKKDGPNDKLLPMMIPEVDNNGLPCLYLKPDREPKPMAILY